MTSPAQSTAPMVCPACGCTEYKLKTPPFFPHRVFECGAYYAINDNQWWPECSSAFAAAVALRGELAEAKRMIGVYKKAKSENDERFMGERDEAHLLADARLAELQKQNTELASLRARVRELEIALTNSRIKNQYCGFQGCETYKEIFAERDALCAELAQVRAYSREIGERYKSLSDEYAEICEHNSRMARQVNELQAKAATLPTPALDGEGE